MSKSLWGRLACCHGIKLIIINPGTLPKVYADEIVETSCSHQKVKLYDDDGHVADGRLTLLVPATVIRAGRALPPQTNTRRVANKRGTGKKDAQLCVF